MAKIRTFIAFETPPSVREKIISLENQLRQSPADVRWESPDKFHITIKFLGDVDDGQLPDILALIERISHMHTTFNIVYSGLGAFPNKKQPRVVWIGCENPDGILAGLKDALDRGLAPKGFEIEQRPFHPHLTLGRIKCPQGLRDLTPMLENLTFEPQSIQVKEIVVMKSILQPHGAVYTLLKKIQLR
jgi:2'-5' RNA ligase